MITDGLPHCMQVRVFDSDDVTADDPMAKDEQIGEAHVALDALKTDNVHDFEARLQPQGKIFFRLEWEPVAGKPGEQRRRAIAAAGGVTRVIAMLQATPLKTTAKKMWELIAGVIGMDQSAALAAATADAEHPERAAQAPGIIGIQEQAAATLSDLAYGDQEMQESIIEQGAVGPLLTLIRLGSTLAQENAARTIWHLCASPSNQGVLVEAGAISELVALSKTGSVKAQVRSAICGGGGRGQGGGLPVSMVLSRPSTRYRRPIARRIHYHPIAHLIAVRCLLACGTGASGGGHLGLGQGGHPRA